MTAVQPPFSREAEESVIGQMLADSKLVTEVFAIVQPEHFYTGANTTIVEAIMGAHYADDPIDALSIAERVAKKLASGWQCTEAEAIARVRAMSTGFTGKPLDHAKLVKRDYDYRRLLWLGDKVREAVSTEEQPPEHIAGMVQDYAMRIATDATDLDAELVSFGDSGRQFMKDIRTEMALKAQGIEMGVHFGLKFIDNFTKGLRPGELLIGAGEPGVGKSMIWWRAAQLFAERQMRFEKSRQVGTLVLSLEMGSHPSNTRLAAAVTGLDVGQIREAEIAQGELNRILEEWGRRKDIPLWFNYRSHLRLSQLRAIVTEAIRKHNVGLVVIDHFRHLDTDRFMQDANERDEARARYLKEQIAKDLNVAVVCIAHSVKMSGDNKRPTLASLRGSGQIAAAADVVTFVYRPYTYASEKAKDQGEVSPTEAELIYGKNRNGSEGIADFTFDPSTVTVY